MDKRYPSNWNSIRNKVYQRDRYECQNCGAKGGPKGNAELHAHHIVPLSDGGSNKTSNLQTLCKDCHDAIHQNEKMAPTRRIDRSGTSTLSSDNSEPLPWEMDDDELKKHLIKIGILFAIPSSVAYYLVDLVFSSGIATNAFYVVFSSIMLVYLLGVILTWTEEEFGIDVEQKAENFAQKFEERVENSENNSGKDD